MIYPILRMLIKMTTKKKIEKLANEMNAQWQYYIDSETIIPDMFFFGALYDLLKTILGTGFKNVN